MRHGFQVPEVAPFPQGPGGRLLRLACFGDIPILLSGYGVGSVVSWRVVPRMYSCPGVISEINPIALAGESEVNHARDIEPITRGFHTAVCARILVLF